MLLSAIATSGCTPISLPGDGGTLESALARGDALPPFSFGSDGGRVVTDGDLADGRWVVAFVATRTASGREIVRRLETMQSRLGPNGPRPGILVLVLDREPGGEARLRALRDAGARPWLTAGAPVDRILEYAARFGALVWHEPEGPRQVAVVAIVDRGERIVDLFQGLTDWDGAELAASVASTPSSY